MLLIDQVNSDDKAACTSHLMQQAIGSRSAPGWGLAQLKQRRVAGDNVELWPRCTERMVFDSMVLLQTPKQGGWQGVQAGLQSGQAYSRADRRRIAMRDS